MMNYRNFVVKTLGFLDLEKLQKIYVCMYNSKLRVFQSWQITLCYENLMLYDTVKSSLLQCTADKTNVRISIRV